MHFILRTHLLEEEFPLLNGPRRPQRSPQRPPRKLGTIIGLVVVLVAIVPTFIGYYTDWLWFREVDYRRVFTTQILTRIALFFAFALSAGLLVWAAGFVAYRARPRVDTPFAFANPATDYRKVVEGTIRQLLFIVPVIIGLLAGFLGQNTWQQVLLFANGHSFGVSDPQFGKDYSFYAFTLPVVRLIVDSLSLILIFAFITALVVNYLLGAIKVGSQVEGKKAAATTTARVELMVIAGVWMLLRVGSYWLDRYDLLTKTHETFQGGSYTDIHAYLPAKILLMIIGVVVAAAFFSAIVLKDLRIPAAATVLMLLSSIVIGGAWPLMMERFSVAPNRAQKESEYIARNIEATRYAYGLTDDKVTYERDWGSGGASQEAVADDAATLSNIRLLDPAVISPTFTQQQQLKNFYGFPDTLAIDRYTVDGTMHDYVVAAREINPRALSGNQTDWINRHTVYTHGNGFVAAQANKVDDVARDVGSTRGGYPVYTVSDLQSMERAANSAEKKNAEKLGIQVDQPRLYFGPVISKVPDNMDYAIVGDVGGNPAEYDTDNSTFTYDGKGGVGIGNFFNRLAFTLRYQEINMLLSDRIGSESKIIFERDPRDRVKKVAPWLTMDSTTYPAVIDGRIKWVVDGYTTLNSLPYAQGTSLQDATEDALNKEGSDMRQLYNRIGYIRNSVKATVDAYDGTVDLYEFDTEDPVLKAWEGVFPGSVKPRDEISPELMEHLRYPEDLFKVQRQMISKYHVDDPRVFFTNDAFWSIPGDPGYDDENKAPDQPPYYVVSSDPETNKPSFQLITAFRGLNREFLAAHMAVSSDPDSYGKITVRVLPTDTQTQGPKQAQDTMMSSDQIARDRSLWTKTNKLSNGNLLTLPVGGGDILYVEPLYSQRKDQESAFPKLLRVLVSYGGKVGYAPTIAEALSQVGIDPKEASDLESAVQSGGDVSTEAKPGASAGAEGAKTSALPAAGSQSEKEALQRVDSAIKDLDAAKGKSFEEYGRALDNLDKAMNQYKSLRNNSGANAAQDKGEEDAPAED